MRAGEPFAVCLLNLGLNPKNTTTLSSLMSSRHLRTVWFTTHLLSVDTSYQYHD